MEEEEKSLHAQYQKNNSFLIIQAELKQYIQRKHTNCAQYKKKLLSHFTIWIETIHTKETYKLKANIIMHMWYITIHSILVVPGSTMLSLSVRQEFTLLSGFPISDRHHQGGLTGSGYIAFQHCRSLIYST